MFCRDAPRRGLRLNAPVTCVTLSRPSVVSNSTIALESFQREMHRCQPPFMSGVEVKQRLRVSERTPFSKRSRTADVKIEAGRIAGPDLDQHGFCLPSK